ncbi:bifunctional hydroxymethylpyrimidine kinase/phosphomethylpyrimidine kinase [Haloarcula sp. CBA1130]|uniref:bifunctional hydroxymethylpyrimidine kinase/phosphomethylpyrimidine kinase n=1 Tax=unclassified Haloarcula TaxID=2624677 RepID=UPI0012445BA4|nr:MULTISPECIES: bifunctional hydroxymethylpyrimidine kinase/phosphomethylpyrimidine kinase [unclassified Haloarcula]KAA9399626.1 bifunctional hydroxymethylpyrimidine kinase/phosphomethylpyrimidine kinase [Haloarcula sp. CBA1129]KAA9401350.1 bifunctional hydroxymethylpyrimidine kinase/phosphomethylpyrimidine kinase [Haloarcula sp. CBA1130]
MWPPVNASDMTRADAPVTPPVVLTIAGSDSGGGAGIQADLKAIEACGGFGTSAITSVTAQNTTGVQGQHLLPLAEIEAQLEAVTEDFDVAAVKTGMLAASEVIDLVVEHAADLPNLVVDPVMVAASGDRLLAPEAEAAYEDLIAEAAVVTPNADEAAVLTGRDIDDPDAAKQAGRDLVEMGANSVLVKGGHVPGDTVVDILVTEDEVTTFRHDRIDTEATHGSGCTLSSAIATQLAHGDDLSTAVGGGIDLLASAVRYNIDVGEGPGSVHHLVQTRNDAARRSTSEAVERVVSTLVELDVSTLVPERGLTVAGATPYAETPDSVAAVEGRIARTMDGVRPNRGVRFGASTTVARALLAAREHDPAVRFAVDCRLTDAVKDALASLDGAIATYDPSERPDDVADDAATRWGVDRAFGTSDETPVAVVGREGMGIGGRVLLLGATADTLISRVEAVHGAVDDGA